MTSAFHPPAARRALAVAALALGCASAAQASPEDDIAALKQSLAAMKADYDHRIGTLESELRETRAALSQARGGSTPGATTAAPALKSATTPAMTSTASSKPSAPSHPGIAAAANPEAAAPAFAAANPDAAAPGAADVAGPGSGTLNGMSAGAAPPPTFSVDAGALAPTGPGATGGAGAFNPSISLILSGLYVHTSQDPANARITGFALPPDAEIGLGSRGFSLDESELALAANIDPYLAGDVNLAITGNNQISPEEAWIATTALPDGLVLKAGRFFSGIGYQNSQHSHVWDFADAPLAYQAMLGTQYSDDGVQLHWLAPTDTYLELGLEAGRGHTFPGDNGDRNAAGMTAVTLHTGGDIGASNNWRAGLSFLQASANGQVLSGLDVEGMPVGETFSGRTRVVVADGVWKWAPNGNATRTYFKLQGEYLQSRRDGNLTLDETAPGAYRTTQSGGYLQAVWQFEPRWRVGLRTERLDPGHADYGSNSDLLAATGYHPTKNSLMLDFNESEFARVRLQLAQDRSRQGYVDNQVVLQYQTALGAHGAHSY
ncbi:MAG TPA: hypothetical protein VH328_01520 [Burkholderiaceae bacterium]|nr:hypothetical protein [Burkholderiaceae bacterium]